MCGIVGVVAERNVVPILLEGLRRLEYRGYDSAGLAVIDDAGQVHRQRTVGKVRVLQEALAEAPLSGHVGIAHTRWATHGVPSIRNAHPMFSRDGIAIVHNGIIENHEELRGELKAGGYQFTSETDTEVIGHRIHQHHSPSRDLFGAVRHTVAELRGAYALAVICGRDPDCIVVARAGCPVVIGLGIGENFVASDVAALLPVTRRFVFLEEGDVAEIRRTSIRILDAGGREVVREARDSELQADAVERGQYRHFMLKEIHEQPRAIAQTLEERIAGGRLLDQAFGPAAPAVFARVRAVQIVACGTSYHAGLVACHLIEEICRIPAHIEFASEYRYRRPVILDDTLFVTISQSGETADTLAALRRARTGGYLAALTICNVAESSMVRESDLVLLTRAGPEIGVASTKAFTTQLAALGMLVIALAKHGRIDAARERELVGELLQLPGLVEQALRLDGAIALLAETFADKHHALFLGRGPLCAIAMEGALKLKEISYIHAEAYPAAELKHGPLALVDEDMPVVAVAPNNELLEKLKSNLQEVRARGGRLYVFADQSTGMRSEEGVTVLHLPATPSAFLAPVVSRSRCSCSRITSRC